MKDGTNEALRVLRIDLSRAIADGEAAAIIVRRLEDVLTGQTAYVVKLERQVEDLRDALAEMSEAAMELLTEVVDDTRWQATLDRAATLGTFHKRAPHDLTSEEESEIWGPVRAALDRAAGEGK